MARTETRRWDVVEHLRSDRDVAAYLEAALEDGDPSHVVAALSDIARAKGMLHVARESGLASDGLDRALAPDGKPEFVAILTVIKALGLRLHATAEHR